MTILFVIAIIIHIASGLYYERRVYARHAYYAALQRKCKSNCKSREWSAETNKRKYCTCGYLRGLHVWPYGLGVLVWPVHAAFATSGGIISGGTYEPPELKVARAKLEAAAAKERTLERIEALEIEAGIRPRK